jgi:hypothetical protein
LNHQRDAKDEADAKGDLNASSDREVMRPSMRMEPSIWRSADELRVPRTSNECVRGRGRTIEGESESERDTAGKRNGRCGGQERERRRKISSVRGWS